MRQRSAQHVACAAECSKQPHELGAAVARLQPPGHGGLESLSGSLDGLILTLAPLLCTE